MTAVHSFNDRVADHLAHNPEAIRIQMGHHEEIVTSLRSEITLLQKLFRRELAWRDAVTAWLIADREELVVTIEGVPHLVHSLFETEDYERIRKAIRAVVEGGIPRPSVIRYRCVFCRDLGCGGETQCASDVDHDRILAVRTPKDVRRSAERVVEVRRMVSGGVA